MNLDELQQLYARIHDAKMFAANHGEMPVAIILDKVLDVVYERAKGLIDNGAEAVQGEQLQLEAWEEEQYEDERRADGLLRLEDQARWEDEGGS